jgi:hypothetical protein
VTPEGTKESQNESGTVEATMDTLINDDVYRYRINDVDGAPVRISCLFRAFPADGTFVNGGCAVLVRQQHLVLRYVAGDRVLAYIPPEEDAKSAPSFVDFYGADHRIGLDQLHIPQTPDGDLLRLRYTYIRMLADPSYIPRMTGTESLVPGPQLGANWSDIVYAYKSGTVAGDEPGVYVAVDQNTGNRLTFRCRGHVIPRDGKMSIFLKDTCPSLNSEEGVRPSQGHVFVPVLTTNGNRVYYYGVANDADLAHKAYYAYDAQ